MIIKLCTILSFMVIKLILITLKIFSQQTIDGEKNQNPENYRTFFVKIEK